MLWFGIRKDVENIKEKLRKIDQEACEHKELIFQWFDYEDNGKCYCWDCKKKLKFYPNKIEYLKDRISYLDQAKINFENKIIQTKADFENEIKKLEKHQDSKP